MTRHTRTGAARKTALSVLALASLIALDARAQAAPADAAAERAALTELRNTTMSLIDALVEQGLLSRAKADELLRKARPAAAAEVPAADPSGAADGTPGAAAWGQPPRSVVRVPYLPETARAQIKEELKNDILGTARDEGWTDGRKLPGWLKSVTISGDVRVRAQAEMFDKNNVSADNYTLQFITQESPAWSPDLTNTQHNRGRFTTRARLDVAAKVSDAVSAEIRLATGSTTSSPSSESATQGNYLNRYSVGLDRAWLRWEPVQGSALKGGRMEVPFDHSDLIWPDDLSVDGLTGKTELDVANGLYAFASAGMFPLQEYANSQRDKWLLGGQLGLDWAPDGDWKLRSALAMYNFRNIQGQRETSLPPTNEQAGVTPYLLSEYPAAIRSHGNTLFDINALGCVVYTTASPPTGCASIATWGLASKFKPVDLTLGVVAKQFRPYQLDLNFDFVRNTGFNKADIIARSGIDMTSGSSSAQAMADLKAKTKGYQAKLGFGKAQAKDKGDWRTTITYRLLERDAWVDAFTDANWHGGGTNYKGFGLAGEYAVDNNATMGLRFNSTRGLDDKVRYLGTDGFMHGNISSAPLRIDTVQVEANVRF